MKVDLAMLKLTMRFGWMGPCEPRTRVAKTGSVWTS